jgi:hypothetical protein
MSLIGEINRFFSEYGEHFDIETINYTKQVVYKIKTSPTLEKFFAENKISASMLLNEIVPYSQYKFRQYGNEKLDMKEIQSVLNIILFSNEIEKLMMEDHVRFSSIGEAGELYYLADDHATKYFNEKYGIEIKEEEEFDFTILEDRDNKEDLDFGFGGNSLN